MSSSVMRFNYENPTIEQLADPKERDLDRLNQKLKRLKKQLKLSLPDYIFFSYIPGLDLMTKECRHAMECAAIHNYNRNFELYHENDGKPRLRGSDGPLDISISHDKDMIIMVLGKDCTGCDLIALHSHDHYVWKSMLGHKFNHLYDILVDSEEYVESAGPRLWAAREAVFKATGKYELLDISSNYPRSISEDTIIFDIIDSNMSVITFSFQPTLGGKIMIAITLKKLSEDSAISTITQLGFLAKDTTTLIWVEKDEHLNAYVFYHRFRVAMEDIKSQSKYVCYSRYWSWFGKVRELTLMPILPSLVEITKSGEWGLVTNSCETTILGEATLHDTIISAIYLLDTPDQLKSSVLKIYVEWYIECGSDKELIGYSLMDASWVKIIGFGVVRREPMPPFMREYFKNIGYWDLRARLSSINVHSSLQGIKEHHKINYPISSSEDREANVVFTETFQSDLEESNFIGNVYFANYIKWQSRVRDRYFYHVNPELFRNLSKHGECLCLNVRVGHLRELMPFETVEVFSMNIFKYLNLIFLL